MYIYFEIYKNTYGYMYFHTFFNNNKKKLHCCLGSCNSTVLQGVRLLMMRVVRIMHFSNRFEHSGPLFLRLNLLDYFNIKNICCYYLCTRPSAREAVISFLFLMNVLRDRPIKNCYNYLMRCLTDV